MRSLISPDVRRNAAGSFPLWRRVVRTVVAVGILGVAVASTAARAQTFPAKPVHLVSPSPPGGGTDAVSRLLAQKLGENAKWTVVVDTMPGAGNNIGLRFGAKAPPDGYTLVMGETSNLAVNQFLYKNLGFDPAKDLAPVALVGSGPLVLVVRSASPYGDLASVLAASRKQQLTFASSGNGTVGHLVAESVRTSSGGDMLHVPYKGAGPAMTDLLGGQVDIYYASLTAALPMIKSGKLRALAVTSGKRLGELAAVPTLIESGYPGFEYNVFYGVVAPAGTPQAVVELLNKQINAALDGSETRTNLSERGIFPQPGTPDDFARFLEAERKKWGPIVKASGASAD
jgi:tripartite-type tricarboxylate transporter receptor subunit TctC